VTVFGAIAVSAMVLAYALERRHRAFVGVFAAACAASSAYGFLIGAFPSASPRPSGPSWPYGGSGTEL